MKQDYYWSLTIEPGYIQAAIWSIEDKTTKVLSIGPSTRWEDPGNLVDAADATLSAAVSNLSDESIEPTKTVFGVSPSWVSEGQIKKEFLEKLRELCSKLSLEPTGFVVIPEAIAHWVKAEEGTPLNAVVIGIGDTAVDIAVFRLGNLLGGVNVGKSVSIVEDVVEGLTRFESKEALPSRFLVYNGREAELEEARQALVKGEWTTDYKDKLTFLHTPVVEVIEPHRKLVAVSLAGASELAEVTGVALDLGKPSAILKEIENDPKAIDDNELFAGTEAAELLQKMSPEDVGFVVNRDVDQNFNEMESREPDETDENVELIKDSDSVSHRKSLLKQLPGNKVKKILQQLKHIKLPAISLPLAKKTNSRVPSPPHARSTGVSVGNSFEHKPFVMGVVILLILLVGGFVAWWFIPSAAVTIYVSPRQLEKRENISVDPKLASADFSQKVLPAQTKQIEVSGDKTTATTGTKVVGEKAKGKVQIRNGTAVGIKISPGTVLVGPNDLKFTVDTSASASAALSPSTPGTAEVEVTAQSIGAESNLAKGETFKVGNYPKSEVDAIVENDLTGGSSREITAVSAQDLKNVEDELTEELLTQGKAQLSGEVEADELFIEQSVESSSKQKTFSQKLGDEAANVKLSLVLNLSAVVVSRSELNQFAMEILKDQVPGGYLLREEQVQTDFSPKGKDDNGVWRFEAHFTANLLPEVKIDEIAQKISGKNPRVAEDYLTSIPGYTRANIKIAPTFPGKLATLPHITKKIYIEVAADQ